jgi:hypothetical protein
MYLLLLLLSMLAGADVETTFTNSASIPMIFSKCKVLGQQHNIIIPVLQVGQVQRFKFTSENYSDSIIKSECYYHFRLQRLYLNKTVFENITLEISTYSNAMFDWEYYGTHNDGRYYVDVQHLGKGHGSFEIFDPRD